MKKTYNSPVAYIHHLSLQPCLDDIFSMNQEKKETDTDCAKQASISFDDEFDSENEW